MENSIGKYLDFDTVEDFIRAFSRKSKNCMKINRMNGFPDASAILEAFSSAGLNPLNSLRVEYSGEDGRTTIIIANSNVSFFSSSVAHFNALNFYRD